MRTLACSAAATAFCIAGAAASAAELTFDASVTGVFFDILGIENEETLTVTGFFVADDANSDGLLGGTIVGGSFLSFDEIGNFSISVSGFGDPSHDFTIASGDVGTVDSQSAFAGLAEIIAPSLAAQNIAVQDSTGRQLTFDLLNDQTTVTPGPFVGGVSPIFVAQAPTIILRDDNGNGTGTGAIIPLPATVLLLIGGVGALGGLRLRRRGT